jgi:hypothetical protein
LAAESPVLHYLARRAGFFPEGRQGERVLMTDLDLERRKVLVESRLSPTGAPDIQALADKALVRGKNKTRNLTVEDTPALWTLPAVLAWRLARDLSAVIELCEPIQDADAIKKGADLLRRNRLLKKLARSGLPSNAGEGGERAIHANTTQTEALLQAIAASTSLRLARVWLNRHKSYERLQQQRPEYEKIFKIIDVEWRRLVNDLVAGKLPAEGNHKETGWCERILPGQFSGVRSLLCILESRVGPYRNVVIARAEVLQLWPERAKEPVTEHPAAEAEALQREPSPLATVPNESVCLEAGNRIEICADSHPTPPAGTGINPIEPVTTTERLEQVLAPKKVTERDLRNWFRTDENVRLPERKAWPAAKLELKGEIPRSRWRAMRKEVAEELGLRLAPGPSSQ